MGLRSTLIIGTVSGLIICLTIVAIAITLEFATGKLFGWVLSFMESILIKFMIVVLNIKTCMFEFWSRT